MKIAGLLMACAGLLQSAPIILEVTPGNLHGWSQTNMVGNASFGISAFRPFAGNGSAEARTVGMGAHVEFMRILDPGMYLQDAKNADFAIYRVRETVDSEFVDPQVILGFYNPLLQMYGTLTWNRTDNPAQFKFLDLWEGYYIGADRYTLAYDGQVAFSDTHTIDEWINDPRVGGNQALVKYGFAVTSLQNTTSRTAIDYFRIGDETNNLEFFHPVPEPGSWAFMLIGAGGLILRRRMT